MTMKRNGGGVNGLTFNAQLTVKLSVFSRLQSLINPVFRGLRHGALGFHTLLLPLPAFIVHKRGTSR